MLPPRHYVYKLTDPRSEVARLSSAMAGTEAPCLRQRFQSTQMSLIDSLSLTSSVGSTAEMASARPLEATQAHVTTVASSVDALARSRGTSNSRHLEEVIFQARKFGFHTLNFGTVSLISSPHRMPSYDSLLRRLPLVAVKHADGQKAPGAVRLGSFKMIGLLANHTI